jgi:hypothetical protein
MMLTYPGADRRQRRRTVGRRIRMAKKKSKKGKKNKKNKKK